MRLKRVLAVVLVGVLVVVDASVGALAWFTGRALPQTSGTLTGETAALPFTPAAIDAATSQTLMLQP